MQHTLPRFHASVILCTARYAGSSALPRRIRWLPKRAAVVVHPHYRRQFNAAERQRGWPPLVAVLMRPLYLLRPLADFLDVLRILLVHLYLDLTAGLPRPHLRRRWCLYMPVRAAGYGYSARLPFTRCRFMPWIHILLLLFLDLPLIVPVWNLLVAFLGSCYRITCCV